MPLFSWLPSIPEFKDKMGHCENYLLNVDPNNGLPQTTKAHHFLLSTARFFVQGQWPALAQIQITSPPDSPSQNDFTIQMHCRFYKSLGLWRTNQKSKAEEIWLQILASSAADLFRPAILLQESSLLMARGYFTQCLSKVVGLKSGCGALGDFWTLRWLTIVATCYEALGQFSDATVHTHQLTYLCRKYPQPLMQLAVVRRKLSLAVETENTASLKKQLAKFPEVMLQFLGPTNSLLLQNERLRATLALDQNHSASQIAKQMDLTRQAHNIPQDFLTSIDGNCELAFRGKNINLALTQVRGVIWQAQLDDDKAGQCSGFLFLARILIEKESWDAALGALETGLRIAKQESYGRVGVRLMIQSCLIHSALGRINEARTFASEALAKSIKYKLPISQRIASVLNQILNKGSLNFWTMIDPRFCNVGEQEVHQIITKHFPKFSFVQTHQFVDSKINSQTCSLVEYLQDARTSSTIEFWPLEGLFFLDSMGKKTFLELRSNKNISQKIALFFLNQYPKGSELKDIFKLQYLEDFRIDRHGSKAAKLLSHTRKLLTKTGLTIQFHRDKGEYFLLSKYSLRKVQTTVRRTKSATVRKSPTRDKLLQFVQEMKNVSTHEICSHLAITRQTLNPMMKELIDKGKVISKGKGRAVCYTILES